MSSHPSGVGVWAVWPRGEARPADPVTACGHTAFEAFLVARREFSERAFCELEFELVADSVPEPPAGEPAPVSPAIVRKVRRRLRQQGVAI